ncbi:MAG: type 4a pilus biogenesis protein PilO [Candidatus Omnitrophica bacterium]|nr:type 4a pilus biogenesis protein PilO [Candidatus Omnitrophota bacterium]
MPSEMTRAGLFPFLGEWRKRHPRLLSALCAAGFLLLVWAVYLPALKALRRSHSEWAQLKAEVAEERRVVDPFRKGSIPTPPPLEALPTVLESLNAAARSKQIQFLQVAPGKVRRGVSAETSILPVDLYLEGGYRSIGEFLSGLSRTPSLEGTFVRQVAIGRQEQMLPLLRARVSIELTLSGATDG